MLASGTRNTNSPRELDTVCSFLIFAGDPSCGGLGVSVTVALGRAKPGSRKTVPETKAYDSGSALLPAFACGRRAISETNRLKPHLFFLFLLFLVFVLIIIDVFFFVLVFFLILRGFELKRIETRHGEIGAALLAG